MTDLINLTPHAIAVYLLTGAGTYVQLGDEHVAYETYTDGAARIPLVTVQYSAVEGLPPARDGVLLIVPLVTALAAPHRPDLLTPYRQVRNQAGTVIGCRALARVVTGDAQDVAGAEETEWDTRQRYTAGADQDTAAEQAAAAEGRS